MLVLSSGYLGDDLQPNRFLATAAARATRRPGAWGRVPPAGLAELRAGFAATIGVDAGDVTVVAGGQSGLSAAFRALAPAGAPVLVEVPTYLGAVAAARAADLRPTPVPTDANGLRPELLAEAFARTGAGVVYTQPTFANPTGTVLAAARRQEVLDVVRAAGAFLIEDDWARHLALDRAAPPPLLRDDRNGHVVYLTSLSKPVAPSLRIGALVARGPAAARLAAIRRVDDLFIARPLQEVAVELFGSPAWPRHLAGLRAVLRERRDALVDAIRRDLPGVELTGVPGGGFHVLDFLFTYYSHRPARLLRWHPGPGVALVGAAEYLRWPAYRTTGDGVELGPLPDARRPTVEFVHGLLTATAAREPRLGCFGLHEWAMVYRARDVRHEDWRLRLGGAGTDAVVESLPLRCTHFDAFRFFTPAARPRNLVRPRRSDQVTLEQPGCLHAGMDLYKWAYKLDPFAPATLVADCFELALDIRGLDMRASPYDLTALGYAPVRIETAPGRAAYRREQAEFTERARPLRARLIALCEELLG
ncbi:MAG: PLP-dependent aminotransferase family protein [Pseudonocardiaceae bacterium]|nr:PLP-dependent aminotransferase family protein [Pseudonocardiaceae bacterium]